MHLLDTDTLTRLHNGHPRVVKQLQQLADPDVGTTIITKAEILRGRFSFLLKASSGNELLRAQYLLQRSEELLAQLQVVSLDANAAQQFVQLRANKRLRRVGHADLIIASITLAHRATLVTRNLKHFRQIPRLTTVNWID